ncbi:hypothetical protein OIU76_008769 [Salix suchowensis]|nr:hypothetical protein OIU76_008769 [Salix suchowensis]
MGVLSFCFLVFCVSQVVSGQQTTGPNEVDALNKLIDYWNLRDKLNITDDPYIQNATWATEKSNPRVACDCGGDTCHITHLSSSNPTCISTTIAESFSVKFVEAQAKRLHRSGVEYEGDSETMGICFTIYKLRKSLDSKQYWKFHSEPERTP